MPGSRNSGRRQAYHRLDLTGQLVRRFRAVSSTLGATVFNVYNRENVVFTDYQAVDTAVNVSPIFMMRRALNVFFKVGF